MMRKFFIALGLIALLPLAAKATPTNYLQSASTSTQAINFSSVTVYSQDQFVGTKVRGLLISVSGNTSNHVFYYSINLVNSSTGKIFYTTSTASMDITNSGAGGLDTGSRAANTTYALWVISTGTDTTGSSTTGMYSLSPSTPVMPTNFVYKALVGFVRTDGSSNIVHQFQRGDMVYYSDETTYAIVNNNTTTLNAWTSVDISSAIPAFASASGHTRDYVWEVYLFGVVTQTPAGPGVIETALRVRDYTNLGTANVLYQWFYQPGGSLVITSGHTWYMVDGGSMSIPWFMTTNGGGTYRTDLYVAGYKLRIFSD